jgi:hypothetical protein
MVIVKAARASEAGELPSQELVAVMGKCNEELAHAGILLAMDGLRPSSQGARVRFSGRSRIVSDGPFVETNELIAGFWMCEDRKDTQCRFRFFETETCPEIVGSFDRSPQRSDCGQRNESKRASARRYRSRLGIGDFGRFDRSALRRREGDCYARRPACQAGPKCAPAKPGRSGWRDLHPNVPPWVDRTAAGV